MTIFKTKEMKKDNNLTQLNSLNEENNSISQLIPV